MPTAGDTTGIANAPGPLPATCNVLGLVCFGPGLHKGDLYTPEMCERIPVNFERLKGHTTPRAKVDGSDPGAKIGHDPQQRLAERLKGSMGFLSVGKVTRCSDVPGYPGYVEVDIRGVPTRAVGGEISAERLNSTSVELLPKIDNPDNPAETIQGPILTGIAFLGEEQPAVRNWPPELRERAKPKATFDDGRPVPANGDIPQEWLAAQADVMRQLAAEVGGEFSAERRTLRVGSREFAERTACFSDISEFAMNDTEQKLMAALGDPEKVKKCMAALTPDPAAGATPVAPPPAPGMPPTSPMSAGSQVASTPLPQDDALSKMSAYADDPNATPEQKMMGAMAKQFAAATKKFADDMDELKKQQGAVNKMAEEAQKKDEEAKMAAFSAQVETNVKRIERKYAPIHIEKVIKPQAMGILTAKTFSSESDRLKTFSEFFAGLEAMPDDPRLKGAPQANDPKPVAGTTPQGAKVLAAIKDRAPNTHARLTGAATATTAAK